MEKKKLTIKEIGLQKLVIIFLAGIFLIVLSFPNLFSQKAKSDNTSQSTVKLNKMEEDNKKDSEEYTKSLEDKLKTVLRKVEGIGDTEVMITLKSSKELVTLKDTPYTQETINEADSNGGSRVSSNINKGDESVMVSEGSGESAPYVIKEIEPKVEGVVVIAEGGENQNTVAEIIGAVQVLFDVPAHKIKVMKMNTR